MPILPIHTPNLVLRDFRHSDLAAYQALRSGDKFLRFSSEAEATPEKSAQLLQLFIAQSQAEPRTRFQLALTLPDDTLIGSCGVRSEAPGVASIGCEIGRRWQGAGRAREAGLAIIAFGFTELQLARVYAETIPQNLAAMRLCRSLGLQAAPVPGAQRTFKGRTWDTVVLELSRAAWLDLQAGSLLQR